MTSWEAWDANGYHENAQSPIQQAEDLFCTFVSGGSIESDWSPHVMRSPKEGVWEYLLPFYDSLGGFGKMKCSPFQLWISRETAKNSVCMLDTDNNALKIGEVSGLISRRS